MLARGCAHCTYNRDNNEGRRKAQVGDRAVRCCAVEYRGRSRQGKVIDRDIRGGTMTVGRPE